jgi:hypothetical protein
LERHCQLWIHIYCFGFGPLEGKWQVLQLLVAAVPFSADSLEYGGLSFVRRQYAVVRHDDWHGIDVVEAGSSS